MGIKDKAKLISQIPSEFTDVAEMGQNPYSNAGGEPSATGWK